MKFVNISQRVGTEDGELDAEDAGLTRGTMAEGITEAKAMVVGVSIVCKWL